MNTIKEQFGQRVICVGFNKTGTTTLGKCFDILGMAPVARPQALHDVFLNANHEVYGSNKEFGSYPYRSICSQVFDEKNFKFALNISREFLAYHDRPWNVGNLFKCMDEAYPSSKFILTWRDPQKWWDSVNNWLTKSHPQDEAKYLRYLNHLNTDQLDKETFIAGYLNHNQNIIDYFKDKPEKLLTINFENGEGWAEICNFLGAQIPEINFPHENKQSIHID